MKKSIILILILIFFLFPDTARGEFMPGANFSQPDLSALDDYLNYLDNQLSGIPEGFSLSGFWDKLQAGEMDFDLSSLFYFLGSIFFKELVAGGALIGQLLILSVISVIFTNLKDSLGKGDISILSRSIVYLLLLSLTIGSFSLIMNSAKDAVDLMSGFLYAILPVLMTLMAAMGNITSVSILHPAMLFALSLMLGLMKTLIFPLIYLSALLRLISYISPQFNLDKMAGLFKDIALGTMSICLSLFITFLGVMGIAGASFDGLALKAVKAASGIFIPVIGRSLADAFDSVLGTTLLLKNAIGVVGVLILLLICALPAVKILVQALIYRLAAALIQPLGEEQLSQALYGLANSLLLLFGAVAACGLLFFFVLSLIVGIGNFTMMMR